MVKLKGPMTSLSASGSLGGTLVFSSSKGRSYARKLTTPKQPKPILQVAGRAFTSFLSKQWDGLSDAQKESWEDAPLLPDQDAYRRYMSYNKKFIQDGLAPTKLYPAARFWGWASLVTWVVYNQNRRVLHSFSSIPAADQWGVIFSRHTADFDAQPLDHVVKVIATPYVGLYQWSESPLAPGTYWYREIPFSNDGNMRSYSGWRNVVVTG